MKFLDNTLESSADNLALDEALLDEEETTEGDGVLRFWEPQRPLVVLGYSNRWEREIDKAACDALGVPVFRRTSGGGTVLQLPGSLSYAVVLRADQPPVDTLVAVNRYVLERVRTALEPLIGTPIAIRGHTDLTVGVRKFSGNAQRRKRRYALVHGTLLLNADLSLIERCLRMPPLQPAYRQGRAHRDFVMNLGLPSEAVKDALRQAWGATQAMERLPLERVRALAQETYASPEWTYRY